MSNYIITMRRSPHISDAERRQRLYTAYSLLLSLSDNTKTVDQCELTDQDRQADGDAPAAQQREEYDRSHHNQQIATPETEQVALAT